MSERKRAFSSGTESGILSKFVSPKGQRTYSAWPPA